MKNVKRTAEERRKEERKEGREIESDVLWPLTYDSCRLLCYLTRSCQPVCLLPCTGMTADINLSHAHAHMHTHHYSSIVVAEALMELPV